ncbi:MAG: hypothetical protein ACE366_17840 [Bradymonadia bacterium]
MKIRSAIARPAAWAFASLCMLSCDAPDPEGTGFVLLDEEARSAGYAVETAGERYEGPLPYAAYADEEVWLVGPGVRQLLQLEPQQVLWLQGADARPTILGATDRLWVNGGQGAAKSLADQIGGEATQVNGRWAVDAPEATYLSAMVQAPDNLRGISPVLYAGGPGRVVVHTGPRPAQVEFSSKDELAAFYDQQGGSVFDAPTTLGNLSGDPNIDGRTGSGAMGLGLVGRARPTEITPVEGTHIRPVDWVGEYVDAHGSRLILDAAGRFSLCKKAKGNQTVIRGAYDRDDEGRLVLTGADDWVSVAQVGLHEGRPAIVSPEQPFPMMMEVE